MNGDKQQRVQTPNNDTTKSMIDVAHEYATLESLKQQELLKNPRTAVRNGILVATFADCLNMTIALPFLIFLIRDLHPSYSNATINLYEGILASAYAIGQFISSIAVGILSDKYRFRKQFILLGLTCNIILFPVFGIFCKRSFIIAWILRFSGGILNGNIGLERTMIGELYKQSDGRTRAKNYLLFNIVYICAMVFGSIIGGILTKPYEHYKNDINFIANNKEFFDDYPYLLPMIATSLLSFIAFIVSKVYILETHPKNMDRKLIEYFKKLKTLRLPRNMNEIINSKESATDDGTSENTSEAGHTEKDKRSSMLGIGSAIGSFFESIGDGNGGRWDDDAISVAISDLSDLDDDGNEHGYAAFKSLKKYAWIVIILNGCLGLIYNSWDEVFPLFAASKEV